MTACILWLFSSDAMFHYTSVEMDKKIGVNNCGHAYLIFHVVFGAVVPEIPNLLTKWCTCMCIVWHTVVS